MESNVVYQNDYFKITQENDQLYIYTFRGGMTVEAFLNTLKRFPFIQVTSVITIKNSLITPSQIPVIFGVRKERLEVEVSGDRLKAYVTLNVSEDEFESTSRKEFITEILSSLEKKGIVFGLKTEVLSKYLTYGEKILVAEGKQAENGKDSTIKMYEIKEPKPKIIEDGNVDHYELNLINQVKQGEWLGERINPTEGIPGKTVLGEEIKPVSGKMFPLLYDKRTVREEGSGGKTTLYARNNGAVNYRGESIFVSNYIEIKGDVDFNTGNVDFDGFITVKGTVKDNFSVSSDENMEILGEYGIGMANAIESKNGSIYVRGGIAGKDRAVIKCKHNLYTKFISNATVICDGSVHIGFYCINSNVTAREVIVESSNGRISGGKTTADIRIEAAELGSKSEMRTILKIKGFDRNALKKELEDITVQVETLKGQLFKVKQLINVYQNSQNLDNEKIKTYEKIQNHYAYLKDEIKELELKRKDYSRYLKTPGEGAVIIKKKCYPKVRVEIKRDTEEITRELICDALYYSEGAIKKV